MTIEQFGEIYDKVKRIMTKKETRLRYAAVKYWYEIYEHTLNFERSKSIEEDLNSYTVEDVYEGFKDFTYDTLRDSIKRIEFWLYHTTFDGQMMESEITMNSELKLYHSLKEIN